MKFFSVDEQLWGWNTISATGKVGKFSYAACVKMDRLGDE